MILNFLKKVPAGMMVIPLLLGSLIVTIFPNAFEIGGLTAAVFSSAGTNTLLGAQLFCMGTALSVKDMPKVLKRGGVLLLAKFAIGAAIGILVGKVFGAAGFLGLTPLAIICAVTNSNGSVYLTLMGEYGDEADCGCFPLLALNDGPFFTLVALGTGINLTNVIKGGFPGILLGLITVFVGGGFILLCDKFITRRPGYAAWAVATTAGNAVAVPAAVALIDTAWEPYVATVTVQVAASVVVSCILAPIITSWWAKKHGCPKMPLEGQEL